MKLTPNIKRRLSDFFNSYRQKVSLLKGLSRKRKYPDEIILLVCCYIDQLGGCIFSKAQSTKSSFELILRDYSGERDEFDLISVGDLSVDLIWMAEIADTVIGRPGRIQLFSDEQRPLIRFIDQGNIPWTAANVRRFLLSIVDGLKSNFRIHPNQTAKKKSYGEADIVKDVIMKSSGLRTKAAGYKEEDVRGLIKEYSYASILYREYRCKVVHEAEGVHLDLRKFWKYKRPYFVQMSNSWSKYELFKLEFPSFFLINCIEICIDCVEKRIIGRGNLPVPIWSAICDIDEFEFLDAEGIKEKSIKLNV